MSFWLTAAMHRVTLLYPWFTIPDITQPNSKMRTANFYPAPKIGAVSYLPASVIYCHRLREQLRPLRVNRKRTPVINVKYIVETVTLPEIEDSQAPASMHGRGKIYLRF